MFNNNNNNSNTNNNTNNNNNNTNTNTNTNSNNNSTQIPDVQTVLQKVWSGIWLDPLARKKSMSTASGSGLFGRDPVATRSSVCCSPLWDAPVGS
eukprot:3313934-Pyramimonas_sp.AAC.1